MSFAVDDENRFHVEPWHVSAPLKLSFTRTGQLLVEVGQDSRELTIDEKTVRALIEWLSQNSGSST